MIAPLCPRYREGDLFSAAKTQGLRTKEQREQPPNTPGCSFHAVPTPHQVAVEGDKTGGPPLDTGLISPLKVTGKWRICRGGL